MMKNPFIITDIDGCLTAGRGKLINEDVFTRIRQIGKKLKDSPYNPWICLITARPQPYLEAILQLIGNDTIGVFEWGSGIFWPEKYKNTFHPLIGNNTLKMVRNYKIKLEQFLQEQNYGFIQAGKEVAITIYPFKDQISLDDLHERILDWLNVNKEFSDKMDMHRTNTFVNLLPKDVNKKTGLRWMLKELKIDASNCFGIGDGIDDLQFLVECHRSAAPANAAEEVKKEVDYVSSDNYGEGWLDCVDHILKDSNGK